MSHIDRVIEEKAGLEARLGKLYNFLYNDISISNLDQSDIDLLSTQYEIMSAYSKILKIRIEKSKAI
jgi:hypothetical protein